MEQSRRYKSMQTSAVAAISIGVLLIVAAVVSGLTIVVALGKGILIHTFSDVRSNVVRIVFEFIIPFIGGIALIICGLKLLRLDREYAHKEVVSDTRKSAARQKEKMLDTFLNAHEKRVMELLKSGNEGALQSDLVVKTGYSKVRMHRILKSLENKGLIRRGRFGITNRVFVNG